MTQGRQGEGQLSGWHPKAWFDPIADAGEGALGRRDDRQIWVSFPHERHPPPTLYIWLCCALAVGAIPAKAGAFCIGWDKSFPNYDSAYYSVSHEFRRAKYVVKTKVVGETWVGEDGLPKPLQPRRAYSTITALRVLQRMMPIDG